MTSLLTTTVKRFQTIRVGLLFIAGLLVLAFGFQGSRGLYNPDEGYYVGIAQMMAQTGEWTIPRLHHVPWLDKPPLSLWGIAAGLLAFGQNEWGARAFHGLSYALTTLIVFLLGRSMGTPQDGWIGATVYATMVIPFAAANVVTPDTPLTLWTTAAFYCFWRSAVPREQRAAFWKLLMCAALGLGFLTKGPAALIPASAMFIFLVVRRQAREYFLTTWVLPCFGVFAALGLGWYAYVSLEVPGALAYFWDNQVFGRTVSAKYARNAGLDGALIYLPVIIAGTLPWSIAWWPNLWRNRTRFFRRTTWGQLVDDAPLLFLVLWIAVPLLILAVASSKLPLYALPVFPALALLTARLIPSHSSGGNPLRLSRPAMGMIATWCLVLVAIKAGAAYYPHGNDMRALYSDLQDRLPAVPYEIVAVNEHLEGLGFYLPVLVEQVTTSDDPYPFFVLPEHLTEEVRDMQTSAYAHVLICKKEKRGRAIREELTRAGIAFEERELRHDRFVFTCLPTVTHALNRAESTGTVFPPDDKATSTTVRLIALGDTSKGNGKARQSLLVSTLRRLHGARSLHDGVILLGDTFDADEEDARNPAQLFRRQFEQPFAPLIEEGVPFYAVLGNHDDDHGFDAFLIRHYLFRMEGRRHYSQVFGEGLVELFVMDSNTFMSFEVLPNRRQLDWLETALSESDAIWKIVALHHPLRTTGTGHRAEAAMARVLEPIFARHGISLVLQGHNHVYERLSPVNGIVYLTAGNGGTVDKGGLRSNASERLAGNDRTEGFVLLEFDGRQCEIIAYDSMGNMIDKAVTRKHSMTGAKDEFER